MTVCQPAGFAGFTHASSVIPFVRSSDALSGTVTQLLTPSNARALPKRPAVHLVLVSVPVFPSPDASAVVVPEPSSKPYAATSAELTFELGDEAAVVDPPEP